MHKAKGQHGPADIRQEKHMSPDLEGAPTGTRMRNKKRALVVIASLVAAGGVGSVAFGYWTQSGAGTGSATTGTTSNALQVSQATASGVMPGVPVALSGTIANSNSATVRVSGLTGVVSVTSPATGCTA